MSFFIYVLLFTYFNFSVTEEAQDAILFIESATVSRNKAIAQPDDERGLCDEALRRGIAVDVIMTDVPKRTAPRAKKLVKLALPCTREVFTCTRSTRHCLFEIDGKEPGV